MAPNTVQEDNMFDNVDQTQANDTAEAETGSYNLSEASDKSFNKYQKDKAERVEFQDRVDLSGKDLKISKVELTRPKLVDENGNRIEPKSTQSGEGKYYEVKLGVYFEGGQTEFYPGAKVFVRKDGTLQDFPSIQVGAKNRCSKLFDLVAAKIGKDSKDMSLREFLMFLSEDPVVVTTKVDHVFMGNDGFVNEITSIK